MSRQIFETSPKQLTLTAALGACALLAGLGCQPEEKKSTVEEEPVATSSFRLTAAPNCQVLEDRFIDTTTEQILRDRYSGYYFDGVPEASGNNATQDASADGNSGGGEKSSPDDYTGTNNQEDGVDEADFLKTDGEYIYTLSGRDVVILDSWPAKETHEVGRYPIANQQDGWPAAMFLKGDSLAVLSYVYDDYQRDYDEKEIEERDYFYGTRITVLDISDRSAPRMDRQIDIEGWYTNARMIDGDVYVISNSQIKNPINYWQIIHDHDNLLPPVEDGVDEARQTQLKNQARPIIKAILRSEFNKHDIKDLLPRKRQFNSSGQEIAKSSLYECSDIYLPDQLAQTGILNITHLDLDDKSTITSTGLLAQGWQVYASQKSLFVAMTSNWWWWGWGNQEITSHIHKFNLDTPDHRPVYKASGEIDGWIHNQFSMSEHNDHLRVASSNLQWEWNEATMENVATGGNHVTILKEQTGQLVETGSIRDLAPGETIYSARFMGDKGYVVTFRQTDPLFTFDLSDPTNPKLEGELKINGFSSYIHPMGENHLLTIGQDADDDGRVQGVHLQIFDVTDMKNPTRTFQERISTGNWSSWSEAMWDHHAFTYHPVKKILAVPVNIHQWRDHNNGENFSGLILYKADATTGFEEIGRVNHADVAADYWCMLYPNEGWACDAENDQHRWWTSIRRSIFIEDYVYSFGDIGLKVNDLLAPENEHVSLILNQSNN